jgi:hypothetical protein
MCWNALKNSTPAIRNAKCGKVSRRTQSLFSSFIGATKRLKCHWHFLCASHNIPKGYEEPMNGLIRYVPERV